MESLAELERFEKLLQEKKKEIDKLNSMREERKVIELRIAETVKLSASMLIEIERMEKCAANDEQVLFRIAECVRGLIGGVPSAFASSVVTPTPTPVFVSIIEPLSSLENVPPSAVDEQEDEFREVGEQCKKHKKRKLENVTPTEVEKLNILVDAHPPSDGVGASIPSTSSSTSTSSSDGSQLPCHTLKKIPFRRLFTRTFVNKLMAPFAGVKLNEKDTLRMKEMKESSNLALQAIEKSLKQFSAADELRIKYFQDGTIDEETNASRYEQLMKSLEGFRKFQIDFKTNIIAGMKRLSSKI